MNTRQLIFVGGLHRSGTTLLHKLLSAHPDISGFVDTGAPKDEGQHLQSVYNSAAVYGGPGRFGFKPAAFMDETHPLATPENAGKLIDQWSRHWDADKPFWIEKSPPNLVRTRFLQKLFPGAKFIIILRHPIAVAYATRKWSKTSVPSLIDHSLICYERLRIDMAHLKEIVVIRYEDFIISPHQTLGALFEWIGAAPFVPGLEVNQVINEQYFTRFEADKKNLLKKHMLSRAMKNKAFEQRANEFGYSIENPREMRDVDWIRGAS